MYLEKYPNLINDSKTLEFQLKSNGTETWFNLLPNKTIDSGEESYFQGILNFRQTWSNAQNIYQLEPQTFAYNKCLIQRKWDKNWQLTTETKLIQNYKCFKATYNKLIDKDKGTYETITAWYCPELPYPIGPNGVFGLPGLIMELHSKSAIFGISKIEINSNTKSIEPMPKVEILSEEEYEKRSKEGMELFFKQ